MSISTHQLKKSTRTNKYSPAGIGPSKSNANYNIALGKHAWLANTLDHVPVGGTLCNFFRLIKNTRKRAEKNNKLVCINRYEASTCNV